MDTVVMRFGSVSDVEDRTKEAVDILAPTRRFILGSSDSFAEGTPDENIIAFFEAGRACGQAAAKKLYG
jgi:hypothetical protein